MPLLSSFLCFLAEEVCLGFFGEIWLGWEDTVRLSVKQIIILTRWRLYQYVKIVWVYNPFGFDCEKWISSRIEIASESQQIPLSQWRESLRKAHPAAHYWIEKGEMKIPHTFADRLRASLPSCPLISYGLFKSGRPFACSPAEVQTGSRELLIRVRGSRPLCATYDKWSANGTRPRCLSDTHLMVSASSDNKWAGVW